MQNIPQPIAEQALSLINQSYDLVKPYLQALTPEDRRNLPKVGDSTEAFLSKSIDYLETNGNFRPAYMDVNTVKTDYALNRTLTPFNNVLNEYASLVSDTRMRAGSEAYTGVLQYYNSLKEAAKRRIPGAKMILEDLMIRFEKKKRKVQPATEKPESNNNLSSVA